MIKLPAPSQTARVVMNAGTLSGFDVLDLGKVEPGAVVELKDGSTATVVKVGGKRISRHGGTRGSVHIRRDGDDIAQVDGDDVVAVLRRPPVS
jgi:hypothetical protein